MIRYVYVQPKKPDENKPSTDTGHYIRSETDNFDLKKSDLATKITAKNIIEKYRNLDRKKPYKVSPLSILDLTNAEEIDRFDTIETLEDIASLQPGKSVQLAAKKISEKYQKMTEVNRRKNILWLPGKIINIETVETPQGNVNVPVPISNTSKIKTAKKNRKKYEKIRKERAKKLAQIKGVEIIELPKPSSKSARITAKKISNKYKKIRNKRNI